MAKTACEESAEKLWFNGVEIRDSQFLKDLRAEALELKRLRGLVCSDEKNINKWLARVNREKARIQQARKAK